MVFIYQKSLAGARSPFVDHLEISVRCQKRAAGAESPQRQSFLGKVRAPDNGLEPGPDSRQRTRGWESKSRHKRPLTVRQRAGTGRVFKESCGEGDNAREILPCSREARFLARNGGVELVQKSSSSLLTFRYLRPSQPPSQNLTLSCLVLEANVNPLFSSLHLSISVYLSFP